MSRRNGVDLKPVRIQRKRTRGYNMQAASPNGLPVVYVGRPTRWGNPHTLKDYAPDRLLLKYEQFIGNYSVS